MKYWLLTSEYPPFFGGGISTYCYFTAKMLSGYGHAVSVFVNDDRVTSVSIEVIEQVRIIRFNPIKTGSAEFLGHTTNISYEFAEIVKAFIEKEGKPDIIEAQEYLGIAYYLLQYKHLLYDWCKDVPVLITMHSPSFLYMQYNHISEYKYPNYWICEMERSCLQAADFVISPSFYIIKEIEQHFQLSHNRVQVVPNPYQGNMQLSASIISNAAENKIIFYGKLTAQKGAFKLLAYFDELWKKGFTEPLYLIGGQDIVYHPESLTMGEIIRKRYNEYIAKGLLRLVDKIQPAAIAARLSNAKVVIVPSDNDNLPYVVLEMMHLGNIVLVSKQGGQSEVVSDGIDGFIFDHKEEGSFEKQLYKVLGLSDEERKIISKNAIVKIKQLYDLPVIYSQKAKVVQQLTSQSGVTELFPFTRTVQFHSTTDESSYGKNMLSVVVPYYNMGGYIDEAIKSIQRTDFKNKEIIIVNDGSTDKESIEKLLQYRQMQGVKVLDTKNEGLAKARNTGAALAEGEYLAFLDADDMVAEAYYSKAIKILSYYRNMHFVGCWTRYFGGSSKVWPTFTPEAPLILYHNTVNSSALVYKRSAFLHKGINDTEMTFQGLEDYESVVSLLANGYTGVVLPETLFFYRVRKDSMIRSISKAKKLYLLQYISKKHKKFYAKFAADINNLLQANGQSYDIDNPSLDRTVYVTIPLLNSITRKSIGFLKKNAVLKRTALRIYRKFKS